MKTIYSMIILIFSLWVSSAHADCSAGFYEFYCRGGGGMRLDTIPGPNQVLIVGTFKKNLFPYSIALERGIQPGHCTWHDRTFFDEEPANFHFKVANNASQVTAGLLTQCASQNNCVYNACASNAGLMINISLEDTFHTIFEAPSVSVPDNSPEN